MLGFKTAEHIGKDFGGTMLDLGSLALHKMKESKAKSKIQEHLEEGFLIIEEHQFNDKEYEEIKEVKAKDKFDSEEAAILHLIEETITCGGNTLVLKNIDVKDKSRSVSTSKDYKFSTERNIIDISAKAIGIAAKRKEGESLIIQFNNEYKEIEKEALSSIKELKEMLEAGLIDENEYNSREANVKEELFKAKKLIQGEKTQIEETIKSEKLNEEKVRKLFEGNDYIEFENFKRYKYSSLVNFFKDKYSYKGFKVKKNINLKDEAITHLKYKDCEIILIRKINTIQLKFINIRANLFTDKIEKVDKSILVNKTLQWESDPNDDTRLTYEPDIISVKPLVKATEKELIFNFDIVERRIDIKDLVKVKVVDEKKGLFIKKPIYRIVIESRGDVFDNVVLEDKEKAYKIVKLINETIKK